MTYPLMLYNKQTNKQNNSRARLLAKKKPKRKTEIFGASYCYCFGRKKRYSWIYYYYVLFKKKKIALARKSAACTVWPAECLARPFPPAFDFAGTAELQRDASSDVIQLTLRRGCGVSYWSWCGDVGVHKRIHKTQCMWPPFWEGAHDPPRHTQLSLRVFFCFVF